MNYIGWRYFNPIQKTGWREIDIYKIALIIVGIIGLSTIVALAMTSMELSTYEHYIYTQNVI